MCYKNFPQCRIQSPAGKQYTGFPFGYGKHAAGAVTSGLDSIHLEMAEFAAPFDAGRTGMNRLSRRVFLCLSFLLLNAPPAFMPEQRPISIKQEAGYSQR